MSTIEFPALDEVEGKLADRQKRLTAIIEEAGPDRDLSKVKSIDGGKDVVLEELRKLNEEANDLGKKRDEYRTIRDSLVIEGMEDHYEGPSFGTKGEGRKPSKSFGQIVAEQRSSGRLVKGAELEVGDVEVKTLFSTSAGWGAQAIRTPRMVPDEQRPVQLVPRIPQRNTDQTAVVYMEETTFTNNAAEVAEGGTKPEAALALTERTSPVRKIAVWIPVTEEQLEDVAGIQQYLDNRMGFMVMQRLDGQLVSGDGSAPNLRGLLNVSGIQTQAKGTDPVPDAILKAITKVRVTGQAMPNLVVLHPNDWQDIRLLRTADGVYIWGNPSEAGPERIWGLDVAQVQAATDGTGVVLDTSFTELAWKKGLTLKITDSHDTYFIKNQYVVLAELRCAFTVFRPAAVCQVTGI